MASPPRPPVSSIERVRGPLAESLVTLAGMPDDASDLDTQLVKIARLIADTVTPVSYASVTALREGAYTTVAATSQLAIDVDKAQYADKVGPCLEALEDGRPIAVPDISATMKWPGFRDAAYQIGLRASVSVPVFAGSGAPIAVLNLYGHDSGAMATLAGRVLGAYDPDQVRNDDDGQPGWDAGSGDLIAGLNEAFTVRTCIQLAIGLVIQRDRCSPAGAYLLLRARSAETGESLPSIAKALVDGSQ